MARVRRARIVEMAEQSRFAGCAPTVETAHAIDARGTVETRRVHTVVDVLAAVRSRPSVDTDARVPTVRVRASGTVLAHGRTHRTLVHVVFAVFAHIVRWTFAAVRIDGVHAGATVLAEMAGTVVDVLLAVHALEACWKSKTNIIN